MRRFLLVSPLVVALLVGYVFPRQVDAILARGPAAIPSPSALAFHSPTPIPTATPTAVPAPTARPPTVAPTIAPTATTVPGAPTTTSVPTTAIGVSTAAAQAIETLRATPTPLRPTSTPIVRPPRNTGGAPAPTVNARSVVVMDEESGEVLHQVNGRARRSPASVTKIMTAMIAIENGNPRDIVVARYDPAELVDYDSTVMGLRQGETITLEDLLYGLMLPSGNDAALVIARHIAGSTQEFVALMNQRARELGMTDTQFVNPHGRDANGHYSSAYDMTVAARYAYRRYPLFDALSRTRVWKVNAGDRAYDVFNLNRLLNQYEGADGVKIGYDELAGRTIVASASRNGRRVYVSLFGAGDLVVDSRPLFDWAFKNFVWETTASPSPTARTSSP